MADINNPLEDGFRMHEMRFDDDTVTVKYTHANDSVADAAITKEIIVPYDIDNDQVQYWMTELLQAVTEMVEQIERHIRDKKSQMRIV